MFYCGGGGGGGVGDGEGVGEGGEGCGEVGGGVGLDCGEDGGVDAPFLEEWGGFCDGAGAGCFVFEELAFGIVVEG